MHGDRGETDGQDDSGGGGMSSKAAARCREGEEEEGGMQEINEGGWYEGVARQQKRMQ